MKEEAGEANTAFSLQLKQSQCGRAQVLLPSGCSKNSTDRSCHLMKCLLTEQIRVSTEKALPAQYFHYQKWKTKTVVSVGNRIMRPNTPRSILEPGIYNLYLSQTNKGFKDTLSVYLAQFTATTHLLHYGQHHYYCSTPLKRSGNVATTQAHKHLKHL